MNFKDLITPFDIMVIASGIDHSSGCKLSELIDFIAADTLYVGFKHNSLLRGVQWRWVTNVGQLIKWEAIIYTYYDRYVYDRYVYDRYVVKWNSDEFSKFVRDALTYIATTERFTCEF